MGARVDMVRLQKYLAESGVASRRAGEEAILAGRVQVNSQVVRLLGTRVDPGHDQVQVDGRLVRPKRKRYVALHKPRGYVCSRRDQGRQALVADLIPAEWSDLHPIGRLDKESEGLLFLTNDGDFTLHLTHPRYGVRKIYEATIKGRVEGITLPLLTRGVVDRGERLRAASARLLSANASRSVVELELAEGRHHEVRRLFEALGFTVERLVRTRIGSVRLGELKPGRWRVLAPAELRAFTDSAPPARGRAADVDRNPGPPSTSGNVCAGTSAVSS